MQNQSVGLNVQSVDSLVPVSKGCLETNGQPFGVECIVALYHQKGPKELDTLKKRLIEAFNGLNVEDMEEVTELYAITGSV